MNNRVYSEYLSLKKQYPELQFKERNNNFLIFGEVRIYAQKSEIQLLDDFEIEITISDDYPKTMPTIKELSNKIPSGYEHVYKSNNLCLGVNTEILLKFRENPHLLYWFNEFVVNYFYGVMYYKKYGIVPFGERSHNEEGIIEFYQEYFEIKNIHAIYKILLSIYNKQIKKDSYCICGSTKKTKNCHYLKMQKLRDIDIKLDINNIARYIKLQEEEQRHRKELNKQRIIYIEKASKYPYDVKYFRNMVYNLFLKK